MSYSIGDEVVCVNDTFGVLPSEYTELPKEGQTYTVTDIRSGQRNMGGAAKMPVASVLVAELTNGVDHQMREVGFAEYRFVPLQEKGDEMVEEYVDIVTTGEEWKG